MQIEAAILTPQAFQENIGMVVKTTQKLGERGRFIPLVIAKSALQNAPLEQVLTGSKEETHKGLVAFLEENNWGNSLEKSLASRDDCPDYLKRKDPRHIYFKTIARITCENLDISPTELSKSKNQDTVLHTFRQLEEILSPDTITWAMKEVFAEQIAGDAEPLTIINIPEVLKRVIGFTGSLNKEQIEEFAKQAETLKSPFAERVQSIIDENSRLRALVASQEQKSANLQVEYEQTIKDMQAQTEALIAAKEKELDGAITRLTTANQRLQESETQLQQLQSDKKQLEASNRRLLNELKTTEGLLSRAGLESIFAPPTSSPTDLREKTREVEEI